MIVTHLWQGSQLYTLQISNKDATDRFHRRHDPDPKSKDSDIRVDFDQKHKYSRLHQRKRVDHTKPATTQPLASTGQITNFAILRAVNPNVPTRQPAIVPGNFWIEHGEIAAPSSNFVPTPFKTSPTSSTRTQIIKPCRQRTPCRTLATKAPCARCQMHAS